MSVDLDLFVVGVMFDASTAQAFRVQSKTPDRLADLFVDVGYKQLSDKSLAI